MTNTIQEQTPSEGAQPPLDPTAPNVPEDPAARIDRARVTLRGDTKRPEPEPALLEQGRDAMVEQFDPETDEFLEQDPASSSPGDQLVEEKHPDGEHPAANDRAPEEEANPPGEDSDEKDPSDDSESKDGAEEASAGKAKRIDLEGEKLSARDYAVIQLVARDKVSIEEAERRLFGGRGPAPAPAIAEAAPAVPTAAEIEQKIEAVKAERKAATESLDAAKAGELNDRLSDLRDQLRDTKHAEAARQETALRIAQQRYAEAETRAITRVTELYPEARVKGSVLHEAMRTKAAAFQADDPAFLQNPRWPILLAVETAVDLGLPPKSSAASAPAKVSSSASQVPAPRKVTRPAPSPAPGTASTANPLNGEAALRAELKAAKARNDSDGVKAVMRKIQQAL